MMKISAKGVKSKSLSMKSSKQKPGGKFRSASNGKPFSGKKGKDNCKGQKLEKKNNGSGMEADESHHMEVEYSPDIPLEEKTPKLKKQKKDARQKGSKEIEKKKKPNKMQFGKVSKGKSVDGLEEPSVKPGLKRKRTDSGESSKPKKAKLTGRKPYVTHKTQKEIDKRRKMEKSNYELSSECKALWEQLRRSDLSKEKRQELCEVLFEKVKNRTRLLIFAHDTSRVVQALFKYGTKEHRDAIFDDLKGEFLQVIMSKYAKFFIRKILKYGTKEQIEIVFQQLSGHFRKLLRHKEAGEVVEIMYNDHANAVQRQAIIEEFFGKSFHLFKSDQVKTIKDVIETDPSKRELLLSSLRKTLTALAKKSMLEHSVVHNLFMEYFSNADDSLRADMIEIAREGFVHMLHTRDGCRVAMTGLWFGTAKDRKVIVKTFKTLVAKICKEEFGHMAMLALFDVVDDTKLVQKAILDELIQSLDDLARNEHGRKVLHYLLSPRDSRHFHPDIVSVLQKGDGNSHSKKDPKVRHEELLQYVSHPLLQWVVDNFKSIVGNNALMVLAAAIIKHAMADSTAAMKAFAEMAAVPFTAGSDFHLVDHAGGHWILKRLIKDDVDREKSGKTVLFSNVLLDTVPKKNMLSWLTCNRGCFTLVCLFDTDIPDVVNRLKALLQDSPKTLKTKTYAGAQVLLKKLSK